MDIDFPTDHTGLRVLETQECLQRLASAVVGRVGFALDGDVVVLPVHHVARGSSVYFRTAGASKIGAAVDHDPMAFEVDDFDTETRSGWSVTVSGTASVVESENLERELDQLDVSPWPLGHSEDAVWVQIRPDQISGRELLPG